MKKILVVSDNHLQDQPLANILEKHADSDYFIHCGDSQWKTDATLLKQFIAVRGNNDVPSFLAEKQLTIESRKVFVVHGDAQNVFNYGENPNIIGTEELVTYAHNMYNADVIFYGHTHVPEAHTDRGIFVLNPGSLNFPRGRLPHIPTYAVVIINSREVSAQFYHAITDVDVTQEILKG